MYVKMYFHSVFSFLLTLKWIFMPSNLFTSKCSRYPSTRRILFSRIGICLLIASSLISSGLPSPLYPIYQKAFQLSNLWVNLLFSAYAVGVLLAMMLAVFFGDRFKDRRQLLVTGAGFILVSATTMALATSPSALICGRLLSGIATGLLLGSANAALLELHPSHDARATATLTTINFTLGSAIGPLISGFFIHLHLYPTTVSFIAIIIITLIAIPLMLITKVPVQVASSTPIKSATSEQKSPFLSLPFLIAMCTLIIGWSVGSVFMSAGQFFTRDLAGVHNILIAASLLTAFQVVAGGGQLLSNQFHQQTAIAVGIVLCIGGQIAMCLFAIHGVKIPYEISSVVAGFGYGIAFVGATALVNHTAPPSKRAGYISAYYVMGYVFGNALPAVIVGAITDALGLRIAIILFTSWLTLLTIVLFYVMNQYRTLQQS
ncbi:MFS transporter [Celerinatantimonas sp. MCCC 1A17872]|uniref:MFS transporter n=1 Tax=Celerinatantimonas sp. MCCC 1A17872 TaxID=3177514 RepID=UPI0038C33A76